MEVDFPEPDFGVDRNDVDVLVLQRFLGTGALVDGTARVYDGETLLGETEMVNQSFATFVANGSQYTAEGPGTIDFTAFRNGTIDARFEYQVTRWPQERELPGGGTVVMDFTFDSPPETPEFGTAETLTIEPDRTNIPGVIDATVRLYDGDVLLGTSQIINGASAEFVSSVADPQSPAAIDFTRIANGQIDGHIEYEVTFASQIHTLVAGQILEFPFSFPTAPEAPVQGPLDILVLFPFFSYPSYSATVSLYDAEVLLGTFEIVHGNRATFVASGADTDETAIAEIDFSSFRDGTIDGRLVVTLHEVDNVSNMMELNPEMYELTIGTAIGGFSIAAQPPHAVTRHHVLIDGGVPEVPAIVFDPYMTEIQVGNHSGSAPYSGSAGRPRISYAGILNQPDPAIEGAVVADIQQFEILYGVSQSPSQIQLVGGAWARDFSRIYLAGSQSDLLGHATVIDWSTLELRLMLGLGSGGGVWPDGENPLQISNIRVTRGDLDGDGISDLTDNDDDADGVVDHQDNCPRVANADQANADNDLAGDACDSFPTDAEDGGEMCIPLPMERGGYFSLCL
ncbi:MAG: thrombospondin type 3 repeat-containing protein [Gammaproteobacteria bacterium]|nr:thrombospondin type 3 repeat-containing protein [Gammaproteobacteria bacterium]